MYQVITNSSAIRGIGWEDNELLVDFTDGRAERYIDVPKKVYHEMIEAKSSGLYFNLSVRNAYKRK